MGPPTERILSSPSGTRRNSNSVWPAVLKEAIQALLTLGDTVNSVYHSHICPCRQEGNRNFKGEEDSIASLHLYQQLPLRVVHTRVTAYFRTVPLKVNVAIKSAARQQLCMLLG